LWSPWSVGLVYVAAISMMRKIGTSAIVLFAAVALLIPDAWIAGPSGRAFSRSELLALDANATTLTQEQLRQFHEDGYVILREALPLAWVKSLQQAVDDEMTSYSFSRLFTNQLFQLALYGSPSKGPYEYRGINRWKSNDAVRDFAFHSPAPRVAQQAMGSSTVQIMEDLIFVKGPKQGAMSTGWHRDTNYPVPVATEHQMSTWIPLDDVPLHEQSGVQFLAGSHRWNFSECGYHYFSKRCIDESQHLVRGEDLSLGDMVIFHGNIGHRTVPVSRLKRRRAALAIRWGGDDAVFKRKFYGFKTFNWYDFWPHGLEDVQKIAESPHMQTVIPAEALLDAPRAHQVLLPTASSVLRFMFGRFVGKSEETELEKTQSLSQTSGGAAGGSKGIY